MVRRAAVGRTVHDEHRVAGFHETLCPTGAAVRRVSPFSALGRATMDEHDRVGLRYLLGRFPGHEHGSALISAAALGDAFGCYPEMAAA